MAMECCNIRTYRPLYETVMRATTPTPSSADLLHLLLGGRSPEEVVRDVHRAMLRDAGDPRPLITEVIHTASGMTYGRVSPVRVDRRPTAPVTGPYIPR